MKKISMLICLLGLFFNMKSQNLKLASVFSDHMVIQQGKPIPVWGEAAPGKTVEVSFKGETYIRTVADDGKWFLYLPSQKPGDAQELIIKSEDETLYISDIYIGEVWLASGQSNMDWMMRLGIGVDTEKEIQDANYPLIRFYNVPKETASLPANDMERRKWDICNPENTKKKSAVAYFFARQLHQSLGVPVGIISASWGATSIEAWMSADMLKTHSAYNRWIDDFDTDTEKWQNYVKQSKDNDKNRDIIASQANGGIKIKAHSTKYDDTDWGVVESPVNMEKMSLSDYWGFVWLRKQFDLPQGLQNKELLLSGDWEAKKMEFWINGQKLEPNNEGKISVYKSLLKNNKNVLAIRMLVHWGSAQIGTCTPLTLSSAASRDTLNLDRMWRFNYQLEPQIPGWQNYYNTNTVLYNGMINPILPYSIKGVLWYQGENNTSHAFRYRSVLPMLINDWRIAFRQGNIPFITIQLPNYQKRADEPAESEWAEMREAQAMSLVYPNTGLVTTIDLGEENDIHPKNKLDVGYRSAKQALKLAYKKGIVADGPLFDRIEKYENGVKLIFKNADMGLVIKGDVPKGFAVADNDKRFYWATTKVQGNEIILTSDKVKNIIAVRYAWGDNPEVNIYNKEGFPMQPFRTDTWKGITKD